MTHRISRRVLAAGAAAVLAASLVACTGEVQDSKTITIGWQVPLTGTYEALGQEMDDAFKLYLKNNDNKLGGRTVELVEADEGGGPDEALPAAEKLIRQDDLVAMAGILSSGVYNSIAPLTQEAGIPFVGAGGRPDLDPEKLDGLEGLWHTSWVNEQTGEAIAPYILENIDGPVYAIGPDYAGGHANLSGFTSEFAALGGELANESGEPKWTPFPDTTDFTPYFTEIANSDAKAVFTFYAGANAVDFVKQYAESDIKDLPLFSNFITEGTVLEAQGAAAEGIISAMAYSADLDNAANREFVSEWLTIRDDIPSVFAVSAWDCAMVLDVAIGSIPKDEEVTPEKLNEAIKNLTEIVSPRGNWRMGPSTHAPIQRYYLRQVTQDGGKLSNMVIEDLATLGE